MQNSSADKSSLGAALRTLLALGLPPFASAWISTSQARFGLTIEHIYNESLGQSAGHPQHSLGYLWSQPGSTAEVWGLGGSITWQWDKRLCSRSGLKVEENFWAIPLVSSVSSGFGSRRQATLVAIPSVTFSPRFIRACSVALALRIIATLLRTLVRNK